MQCDETPRHFRPANPRHHLLPCHARRHRMESIRAIGGLRIDRQHYLDHPRRTPCVAAPSGWVMANCQVAWREKPAPRRAAGSVSAGGADFHKGTGYTLDWLIFRWHLIELISLTTVDCSLARRP